MQKIQDTRLQNGICWSVHQFYRFLSSRLHVERTMLKRKLELLKPLAYKKQKLKNSSQHSVLFGSNLQNIKSDDGCRKIRSEQLCQTDTSQDDLTDIINLQQRHSDFIQEISLPFNIKLFSTQQIQVFKAQIGNELATIHFDATGSVVRKPSKRCKRIYSYTAIKISKYQRIVPIFSMISEVHDSNFIFKILNDFRYACEGQHFWPAFSRVVTDFSYAYIHAMCKSLNRCSLKEYLDICYQHLQSTIPIKEKNQRSPFICVVPILLKWFAKT